MQRRITLEVGEQTLALYVPDAGEVDKRAIATLRSGLPALDQAAMRYLDLFVDRNLASQMPDEQWTLEEVEFHQPDDRPLRARFHYTLQGDDGGLWAVEFLTNQDPWRPVRFERRQG